MSLGNAFNRVTLRNQPRTLYDLWQEYSQGFNGQNPAKYFTPYERGQVKYKNTRRKVVLDQIVKLVNSGVSALVAIDMIYSFYGRGRTVTQIINLMRTDRNNNYTPPIIKD